MQKCLVLWDSYPVKCEGRIGAGKFCGAESLGKHITWPEDSQTAATAAAERL